MRIVSKRGIVLVIVGALVLVSLGGIIADDDDSDAETTSWRFNTSKPDLNGTQDFQGITLKVNGTTHWAFTYYMGIIHAPSLSDIGTDLLPGQVFNGWSRGGTYTIAQPGGSIYAGTNSYAAYAALITDIYSVTSKSFDRTDALTGLDGTTPTAPADRYNYEFDHWSPTVPSTLTGNNIYTTIGTDIEPVIYTVTWILDGNIVSTGTSEAPNQPANPIRMGYMFSGWNNGTVTLQNIAGYSFDKDTTFTAVFNENGTPERFDVKFYAGETLVETRSVLNNTAAEPPSLPTGYKAWDYDGTTITTDRIIRAIAEDATDNDTNRSNNTLQYVAIALLVIVIVAAVAMVFVKREP